MEEAGNEGREVFCDEGGRRREEARGKGTELIYLINHKLNCFQCKVKTRAVRKTSTEDTPE